MSLTRQLLEHAERCARLEDPELARMLLADLPGLLALAHRDYAATRVLEIALAHLAVLLEHAGPARSGRPADAVIVESVHKIGIRPTARLYNLPRSTVSDMAKAVRSRTPLALPSATPARTVGASVEVMDRGWVAGGAAASLVHRSASTAPPDTGGKRAMFGNGNGKEVVASRVSQAVLLERLEQLSKLPTNSKEAADIEAAKLPTRRRLVEERDALIAALTKEGAILTKRVEKATHVLIWAAGPVARAQAQEALAAVLLEQQSNSIAQELKPAAFDRELRRTADPRLRAWQVAIELEMEVIRCYAAPIAYTTEREREQLKREAEAAPAPWQDRDDPRYFPQVITLYPVLSGTPDLKIYDGIGRRMAALKAMHLKLRDELPLLALTADELTREYEKLRVKIPPIPTGASLAVPLPMTIDLDLSNILRVPGDHPPAADTSREAPADAPPDGTTYIRGVPQL
jgi:hypothetical protein